MKLYISDLHFGHTQAIQFDHRPFADRDEMDRAMIECWNFRVDADDDVYRFMNTREHALNASACINNYTPASISELVRNNKAFQERP